MAPTTTKTATPKPATTAGVKKAGRPKGSGKSGKSNKAKTAMAQMQAYFKENRSKYKDLDFKEQQKELGKEWKTSPKNPKNQA